MTSRLEYLSVYLCGGIPNRVTALLPATPPWPFETIAGAFHSHFVQPCVDKSPIIPSHDLKLASAMPNAFQGPSPPPKTPHDPHLTFHPDLGDLVAGRSLIARSPETFRASPWLREAMAFIALVEMTRKPFPPNDHNSQGKFLIKRMAHKLFDWLLGKGYFVICAGASCCADLRTVNSSQQHDIDLINDLRSKIEVPVLPVAFEFMCLHYQTRIVDAAYLYLQSFFVDVDDHPIWDDIPFHRDWNDESFSFQWVSDYIDQVHQQPWGRPFQPLAVGHPIHVRTIKTEK